MISLKLLFKVKRKGPKLETFLQAAKDATENYRRLNNAAKIGLEEFIKASPNRDIAEHWSYDIRSEKNKVFLIYNNDAEIVEGFHYEKNGTLDEAAQKGTNIAIIIDTGHGTKDGRWFPGENYLSKATENAYLKIMNYLEEDLKSYE